MATEYKRRQFEEIAARLTADDPSLARIPLRRWRPSVLIPVLVAMALGWGLLSISMVAWGWKGVALTCVVVGSVIAVGVVDTYRRRSH